MTALTLSGMELSSRYYYEVGLPALLARFPFLEGNFAAGRVGEGSECFGFDDELSADHDFGAGFCLWLEEPVFQRCGAELSRAYWELPAEFCGFRRPESGPFLERTGVFSVSGFYSRFLGKTALPKSVSEWFSLPQEVLALCTNGEIFSDAPGAFSAARRELLEYYPEPVRLKKLAAHCALASQAGQYNYSRCLSRNEHAAAVWALNSFIYNYIAAVFLVNRRYMPYGKWAPRALSLLPVLGKEAFPLLEALSPENPKTPELIEHACSILAERLRRLVLSTASGNYLLSHGENIQSRIVDPSLSSLPLMAWKSGWQI